MHPELLVRKRIWLMTLVLTGLVPAGGGAHCRSHYLRGCLADRAGHSSVDESRHCYRATRHDYRPKGTNARHLRDGVHRHR